MVSVNSRIAPDYLSRRWSTQLMKKSVGQLQSKRADPSRLLACASPAPAPDSVRLPEPWCWVAEAWVDSKGREAGIQAQEGTLGIFAVSVHEQYPTDEGHRLLL